MSTTTDHRPRGAAQRRGWALGLLAAGQFMVIMDTSIIGVALPKMRADLGFTAGNLSWVFNAYVVAFGGLLLLGGRLSDLLGARRVFAAGWMVLLAGSVTAGAAGSAPWELAGRATQGLGAALIAPAALTLLMMMCGGSPKELTKALSVYGAAAPAGGTDEQDEPAGGEHAPRAEQVGQPAAQQQQASERDDVGVEHPGQVLR